MTTTQRTALQELCDEQWPAVDQQVAEVLGLPQWKTPERTRRQVFREFRSNPRVSNYDPSNASDRHLLAKAFRQQALPMAKAAANAAIHVVAHLDTRTVNSIRRKLRVKSVPKAPVERPTRFQRFDAQNLELLSFVVERIIPFAQLLEPRFDKKDDKKERDIRLLPGHHGPRVAVPRQALADEWNPAHPWWHMGSGDTLMKQFSRAHDRPHLRAEFLQQVKSEINTEWDKQQRRLAELRDAFARMTEAERARIMSVDGEARMREWWESPEGKAWRAGLEVLRKKSQDLRRRERERFPSEVEYQEWKAKRDAEREEEYRASLTRKDLIEKRVNRLVWRLPDQAPGEEAKLWQSPLRDWFLPEARGERMRFHFWSR